MRFRDALGAPGFGAIAEFKRRSPSAGRPPAGRGRRRGRAELRARPARGRCRCSSTSGSRARGTTCGPRARRRRCRCSRRGSSRRRRTSARRARPGADAALLLLRDLDDGQCAALMREARDARARHARRGARRRRARARSGARRAGDRRQRTRPLDLRDRPRRAARLLAQAPRDRIVIAESAIATRAQGAAAELDRRERDARRLDADARARSRARSSPSCSPGRSSRSAG